MTFPYPHANHDVCSCGTKAQDCVLTRIGEFADQQTPLAPSPSPPSQLAKDKLVLKARKKAEHAEESPTDLDPLIGIERSKRIPFSGGMRGLELAPAPPFEVRLSLHHAGARKVSVPEDRTRLTMTAIARITREVPLVSVASSGRC